MLTQTDLLNWFQTSPDGQKLITEREEAHHATREQLASELATIQAERAKSVVAENKIIAAAEAELQERQDAAAAALGKVQQLNIDRHNATFRFDRAVQDIERKLRETADNEAIDAFIRELQDESNDLCKSDRIQGVTQSKVDRYGNPKIATVETNLPSINRRLAAMGEAVTAAEALKLSPSKDIATELQRLRESLPIVQLEPTGA